MTCTRLEQHSRLTETHAQRHTGQRETASEKERGAKPRTQAKQWTTLKTLAKNTRLYICRSFSAALRVHPSHTLAEAPSCPTVVCGATVSRIFRMGHTMRNLAEMGLLKNRSAFICRPTPEEALKWGESLDKLLVHKCKFPSFRIIYTVSPPSSLSSSLTFACMHVLEHMKRQKKNPRCLVWD